MQQPNASPSFSHTAAPLNKRVNIHHHYSASTPTHTNTHMSWWNHPQSHIKWFLIIRVSQQRAPQTFQFSSSTKIHELHFELLLARISLFSSRFRACPFCASKVCTLDSASKYIHVPSQWGCARWKRNSSRSSRSVAQADDIVFKSTINSNCARALEHLVQCAKSD